MNIDFMLEILYSNCVNYSAAAADGSILTGKGPEKVPIE
jgi:hypothetical protein